MQWHYVIKHGREPEKSQRDPYASGGVEYRLC